MRSHVIRSLLVVGAILILPVTGHAQEASIGGTVTDSSGGVLPGVTFTAQQSATGNLFTGVTDEKGTFRVSVRVGDYRVTAELSGFAPVSRTVEVLVGQTAVVNLQMSPSTIQESVTVTGEAPLISVTQSSLGGNIDPRQMQELPVNGRNWMDLTMLAPGSRTNAGGDSPVARDLSAGRDQNMFQLNVDGQQVTELCCGSVFGQPRYSRDALAEFEFVSNRFDATQGRSAGVQVNVVTKSGTNLASGTLSGYFRNDRFIAADFIQHRVLPYSDQQMGGTFGGPIRKDRVHFFANYEYEREPQTFTYSSPYPSFNIDQSGVRQEQKLGGRVDIQFSGQTRMMMRGNKWVNLTPYDDRFSGGAIVHPSSSAFTNRYSDQVYAAFTQVFNSGTLNEIKGGYAGFNWDTEPYVQWAGGPFPGTARPPGGSIRINLRGYSIGTPSNLPQAIGTKTYSVGDSFTSSFTMGGRHDLKLGSEYIYDVNPEDWCSSCNGILDANNAPVPANIESLFPVWNDASTWNLAPLSGIAIRYRQAVGTFVFQNPRHLYSGWVQDDWAATRRLTLNLGIRYDLDHGALGENIELLPFMSGERPTDKNNVAPRVGFALRLTERTVLRGGYGRYFAQLLHYSAQYPRFSTLILLPETPNDGRADFAVNPYNGNPPTYESVALNLCSTTPGPTCQRRDLNLPLPGPDSEISYSHQASIGMQRQFRETVSVEANYVFNGSRAERVTQNANLGFNPATGANYPFTNVSTRPYPDYGILQMDFFRGRSNFHALETVFTKRFSHGWQASGTYTLASFKTGTPTPVQLLNYNTVGTLPFAVAPDFGGEYFSAVTDQRHRATVNGIWQLAHGFQLSGMYFFGSGYHFGTNYGGDLRMTGGTGNGRLRPDGTIVPATNLVGKPIHRVDVRVQRRFGLGNGAGIDGIVEVFNLFNHANYGNYVTSEGNSQYGLPSLNPDVAYKPRTLQLGFRLAF